MKTLNVLSVFILLLVSVVFAQGATHIVDSRYPRPTGVYATIQLAYNAANAGDTILISPSPGIYNGITLSKQVHIVGTGWEKASESVSKTTTSSFYFNNGSQGSSISGIEINGIIQINTSDITIKRNKLNRLEVRQDCSNILITQNFILSGGGSCCDWYHYSSIAVWENAQVIISNNIINYSHSDYDIFGIYTLYPVNVIICNNIIRSKNSTIILGMSGSNYTSHLVYNNIIVSGGATSGVATTYAENNHNIGNSTQFSTINNNQQNVDMNAVFVDAANHDYHLKAGSPAIGAGLDGTDCGIYGGLYPFVDNGRTWLPMITEIDVPNTVNVNDGLDISVKAKSGK
jgi:hypothetical protein